MIDKLKISPNDPRHYQVFELENGLRVALVQDPEASKGAAALAVRVGHFDDPADREGMAHFLEHMLFLGTRDYPKAGEYQQFISEHGGNHNAWTGPEFTSYYFDINTGVLDQALHRFSQFFTAPLFDEQLVEKERQSVDSEFRMKLQDDMRRFYQVHKETVNPDHPFSKFSVGNQHTLADRDGESVRDELIAFYQNHYSANLMTLVVVSPLPLTECESMVREHFSAVPNLSLNKSLPDVPLYRESDLDLEIRMLPNKRQRQLTLTFPLPALDPWYRHKPLTYLSYLLGYEGPGSLLSVLKYEGLVSQLSAGGGINGYNFKDYNVSYQLTEKGLKEPDRILALTFQYLEMIRAGGIEDWRYAERQQLLERAFRFQEPSKPLELASHLAINMHHYDDEDVVYGDYRMDGLDKPTVQAILKQFRPEGIRLTLIAPDLATDQTAKWYDTPYQCLPLSEERRAGWLAGERHPKLALPDPNPYLVGLLEPRKEDSPSRDPECLPEQERLTLWYKKDQDFNVPKAHLFLALDSETCHHDARTAALTRLYIAMLMDSLSEPTYQAEVAGLSYNIYPHQGGLTLHLSGFTGGQEKLLDLLLRKARQRDFAPQRFNELKAQLIRNWNGIRTARPISRLFNALTSTLQRRSHEPLNMAAALEDCSLEQLHRHIDTLYQQVHIEGLIYGDWLRAEAEGLNERLNKTLAQVSKPGPEVLRQLISIQGRGTMLREISHDHQDSAIIVYYQSRQSDIEKMALFCLLNHSMSSSFFNELRTKQQLGYMVGTSYVPMNRCPGIIFYVQSPVAGPLQLLESIDQFIADYSYALMQISASQWQATKDALCNQILEQDNNLKSKAQRLWVSIGNKDTDFNHREHIAEAIQRLERADLIRYIMQQMRSRNPDRLVLYSIGGSHSEHEPLSGERQITDLTYFKGQADLIDF
ncbi:insulinase family protein [Ferrimonas balearica]|uniref:insulinase family protein n=1 Tax=Ferrimonas balearica TaxID=44012 RepID=UPI001C98FE38|nr:insulinase family protein [Ferrimonas balearica]MBY5922115.1 insulinase family protein [Ferrimonas balearica]MBY5994545.1 insulinase family protein [Ferrimonas balearica]